jgi:starch-binding outer membrane protein, SusD/RagB family
MMKKKKIFSIIAGVFLMTFSSCLSDLDVVPFDDNIQTGAQVFQNPAAYRMVLAKLYAGLAITGQEGPAGMPDISGIDEGFSQYVRALYYHQVLSTDEAVIGWDDQTIKDFIYHRWTSSDVFVAAMYYRIFYQIAATNEYIRETTDEKLEERGHTGDIHTQVQQYRAEARWLRALSYWHAIDLFGNVPFVTENDAVGAFLPEQISRAELFAYVEQELLALAPLMAEPRNVEYGRADRAAAWMVLAKLYMNAEVYIQQPRYTDAMTYIQMILDAGYELEPTYAYLFNADNNRIQNPNLREMIFSVPYHGINTRTYGGTTFMIRAAIGGAMNSLDYGQDGGWGGLRTTSALVNKFQDGDQRAMFFTEGQTLEIQNLSEFTQGYAVEKFTNLRRDGNPGSSLEYTDTDFPMFRLGDVYLMYAETHLRAGVGNLDIAVGYVNSLRERAFGNASGNISNAQLTLPFIIDERARELYWEGHRRTDLIRFELFTGGAYLWPWKGNSPEGLPTEPRFNLYPIPASDIAANPNLTQNLGY